MNTKALMTIIIVAALVAVAVVVVLKLLGHSNPTVIAGGVAGGVVGAISPSLFKKKKSTSQ